MMKLLEEIIRIDTHHIKVQSVEHVVAQGPTIHNSQPGNHTGSQTKPNHPLLNPSLFPVPAGSSLTLLCQLTTRDVALPAQIVWFR